MIYLDANVIKVSWIESLGWIYENKPEGARALLSTVAGSMITVAGVVFSITIVALTLASTQYGPRLLGNFMRDKGNQVVLGTFIATFTYCLLILRTIRGGEDSSFVPHLSVTVGVVFAILSISVLIYFIHHAATSIQASNVISGVSRNLQRTIDFTFPERIGQAKTELPDWWNTPSELPVDYEDDLYSVTSPKSGYLRVIDNAGVLDIAIEKDLILRIENHPGNFIVKGSPIVTVWPGSKVDDEIQNNISSTLLIGNKRTSEQDTEFAIDQLVEIAVRALSPGINDPFTAIMCIDNLSVALSRVAGRSTPSAYRYDKNNNLRVLAKPKTFDDLLNSAFNQIRQYGRNSVSVTIRLLESLIVIASNTSRDKDKQAIGQHAEMIKRSSDESLPEQLDREDVDLRYMQLIAILDGKGQSV
ncbi:MAG: hypothetical protein DHS20C13_04120 [Thermodesulfobacteriota bacterium]|nr:MAG: hypothetical protein DHS20C13_04120 [Thermodesulfobacteriota bacterium]